jgi:hypothetical protein
MNVVLADFDVRSWLSCIDIFISMPGPVEDPPPSAAVIVPEYISLFVISTC